jgi:hypothetical protein
MSDQESLFALENRAFGFQLIERLEMNLGISFKHFFEQDLSASEIRAQVHGVIVNYVEQKSATETASEEWPLAGEQIEVRKALFGSADINVIPNIAVTESNLNIIKNYTSGELNDYVRGVANGLSLIKDGQTAGEVAAVIVGSGLASFALAMIVGTVKALRAGEVFRAAVRTGVRAMGKVSVIVGVALVIITEILLYLIISNKKVFMGMVFNNTDLNLVVKNWRDGTGGSDKGDLFTNTGSMTSFMQTHENEKLDSPFVQIRGRDFIAPGDEDNIISGGIFNGQKNIGFYGTDGAMVLSDYKNPLPRFALLFACPYTRDNGTNVAIDLTETKSAKSYFNSMFDGRGVEKKVTVGTYTFSARVASNRGGEAAGIAVLETTS